MLNIWYCGGNVEVLNDAQHDANSVMLNTAPISNRCGFLLHFNKENN